MKKFLTLLLTLILCVSMSAFFVACGGGGGDDDEASTGGGNAIEGVGSVASQAQITQLIEDIEKKPTKFSINFTLSVKMGMQSMSMENISNFSDGKLYSATVQSMGTQKEEHAAYYIDGYGYEKDENEKGEEFWAVGFYEPELVHANVEDIIDESLSIYGVSDEGIVELLRSAKVDGDSAKITFESGATTNVYVKDGVYTIGEINIDVPAYTSMGATCKGRLIISNIGTQTVEIPQDLTTYANSIEEFKPLIRMDGLLYAYNGKISVKETKTSGANNEYDVLMNNFDVYCGNSEEGKAFYIRELEMFEVVRFTPDGKFVEAEGSFVAESIFDEYDIYPSFFEHNYDTGELETTMFKVVDENNKKKIILDTEADWYSVEEFKTFSLEETEDGVIKAVIEFNTGREYNDVKKLEITFDLNQKPTFVIPQAILDVEDFIVDNVLYEKNDANTVKAVYVFAGVLEMEDEEYVVVIPETITVKGTTYTVNAISDSLNNAECLIVPTSVVDFGEASAPYDEDGGFFFLGTFEQLKAGENSEYLVDEKQGVFYCAHNVYVYAETEPTTPVDGVKYWHWNADKSGVEVWGTTYAEDEENSEKENPDMGEDMGEGYEPNPDEYEK